MRLAVAVMHLLASTASSRRGAAALHIFAPPLRSRAARAPARLALRACASTRSPTKAFTTEYEVKKSLFRAILAPAASSAEARAWAEGLRDPKANHNCLAFVVPDGTVADDDGEPSGTAGKPILAALEGRDVVDAAILVQRYKKGPKLGAGGLIRAYGAAAREAVAGAAEAGLLETNRRVTARLTIKARADKVGDLYRVLNSVERIDERHDGTFVEMDVRVYEDDVLSADELSARVGDATAGTATVTETT
mmetsp:Transcript_23913/g.71743  ORF Transcript_23913/g.71743 Transcript_23913/m.71743 type:complete len:250 (-) Transcript_23913:14-763(-)